MKYFKSDEFKCKCGCGMDVSDKLKERADLAREIAGVPFVITSGARCVEHNKNVNGNPRSTHTLGLAMDIKFSNSHQAFLILKSLIEVGFERIGYNQDKQFFHCDLAGDDYPQPVFFDY